MTAVPPPSVPAEAEAAAYGGARAAAPAGFPARWGWLFLSLAAFFLFLGTRGLNEPDEGRYAEIAREMVASGEWLVPHLNGIEHFQKPPLLYWLTALSLRGFGVHEWAARLPSALAALGIVLLLFLLGRRLLGWAGGVVAALVATSSAEFFLLARLLTPDMLLAFWSTAAITALVFRRRWLFFVCVGLGFLTKGPMALVVPISAALGWRWQTTPEERLQLPWGRGLLLALAIGLSWFIVLSLQSRTLLDYFWKYELLQRFASHAHGRSKPFWFFAPVLLGGLVPWTFFGGPMVRRACARCRYGGLTSTHGLLLGWVVPPLLILSLSGSKLPTYVLPLLPAFALAIAASRLSLPTVWRVAMPATACGLLLSAAAPWANDHFRQQASVKTLAQTLQAQPDASRASIFACEVRAHGWEFYLERCVAATRSESDVVLPLAPAQEARLFDSPEECEQAFAHAGVAYGLVRAARQRKTFPAPLWNTVATAGDFVLITNRAHP